MTTRAIIMIILSFLVCFVCESQEIIQGEIEYKVNIDNFVNRIASKDKRAAALYIEAAKKTDEISFTLSFNKDKSVFKKDKNLVVGDDDKASKLAAILTDNGTLFANLQTREQFLQREFQGEIFNVKSEIKKREWVLTKTTKKIGEFNCFKATSTKENSSGKYSIVAWYTPEIPLSYGPEGFVGDLPGLILELHDVTKSYTCSNINLKPKKDVIIKWPKDVDALSKEEYKAKGEKLNKLLKNNSNKN